ncbi:MAG: TonB-dependent receptor [Tannerellaceae bacterium]|nr:TonB-dependent receptor [Tannerellaceae bacterium]
MLASTGPEPGNKLETNQVSQQKRSIRGTIVDSYNEPVIGANVVEKGTTNGIITDFNGEFSLSVDDGAVLEISYLGYKTKTVTVGNNNILQIVLEEDTQMIDEIVVTGFGLSQKKATLTGAITTIGASEIERSKSPTTSGALVGKIAGLNTRQGDGRPGSGVEMRIRNMGTPLFVIDGIQSDQGQFNNIDFNDIENITILKDASASIYGVRAANGVVVVTTKKGKRNTKPTVSLNAYYGWQNNFKFADPADAKTYVRSYVQSETMKIKFGQMSEDQRRYSREEYDKWMAGTEPGYQSFDWYDYIWNTSPQYYANANITGGSENTNYYISIGHLKQDATIRNYGGFQRTNIQMNIDTEINSRLKVGAAINGRIEERVNPGVPGGDDYWLPRYAVLRNIPTVGAYANGNPNYPNSLDDKQTNFAILDYENSGKFQEKWRVIQLQANAEYDIFDGLKAKALVSYYYAHQYLNNQEYTYKLYGYNDATQEYYVDYEMNTPWRERTHEQVEELTSNIQLAYDKKFSLHSVSGVVGLEAISRKNPRDWVNSWPVSNDVNLIYKGDFRDYSDRGNETQARMGWFGRFNYDYANKYLVEFSGRYDGSWKFPPGDRWGFFPSASVGWRISEETFWKNSNINNMFSDLKIRASYGLVGDDDLGDDYRAFGYMSGYDYFKNVKGDEVGNGVIDGEFVQGTKSRGLPVTTISWIKARILDIGLDVAFFDNRLTGQADFFRRERRGLPEGRYDVVIPTEVGFSLPKENLNSDLTMGWDGMVRWSDRAKDVRYTIGVNATYARFYDWDRYDDRRANSWDTYRNSITHRYGYLNWGLEAIGQFESWEEIANYPIDNDRRGNTTIIPGDIKYRDVNGDGVINSLDERPIAYRQDATPIFNYGINLAFEWKGFDLAMDFSGSFLSTYHMEWEQSRAFQNNGNSPQWLLEDSWRLSDPWDANSEIIPGKYPMAIRDRPHDATYWGSTFWKKNVRYLKLSNLDFGYTLPKHIVRKAHIENLRIYLAGQNLFAITNVQGVDPEQRDTNGLAYPTMRMVNIGINLKF